MQLNVIVSRIYEKEISIDAPDNWEYEDLEKLVSENKDPFELIDESITPVDELSDF